MSARAGRLARLRALIAERELDRLLVTGGANVRYLTGFSGTNGTLLVGANEALLLTDFRYLEQAAADAPGWEIVDGGAKPYDILATRLDGALRVGFDDADLRVRSHTRLREAFPQGVELVAAAGLVERLRTVKDESELDAIVRAAAITDSIYETLANEGLSGRTETEVAWRIETLARERGASGVSFPPIVAAGSHGALPHAEPRELAIEKNQLVVLDLGVIFDGYCSDATRTFATGALGEQPLAVYQLVFEAQQTALDAIAPGVACRAVDKAARDVIDQAGHGERFGHSTGHGVGMEVHELPTLAARSEDVLAVGNVVTVEPGVYVSGEFGVRIEDLVIVDSGGPRILSKFDKQLTVVA